MEVEVGKITRIGGLTCLSIRSIVLIRSPLHHRWGGRMRDYMDRRVTLPEGATSSTCGPPPPCKQALTGLAC